MPPNPTYFLEATPQKKLLPSYIVQINVNYFDDLQLS